MSVQVIEKDGKPEWTVIPFEEYQRLLEEAEMLQDVRAYDEAKKALAEGEELVPSEVTYALLDGLNPVRVWREHRGLTQQGLAEAVGISVPYLSQIESGKRRGARSPSHRPALARARCGRSRKGRPTPRRAGR